MFHSRCGNCVLLTNGNKTASRTNPTQEFNRGLVFSFEPLKNNELFEVKIDKKLNTWSGSIEIGVTVCNPDVIDIPITATDLKGGTWIMLGQGVFRDGQSLHEAYGCDLDKLVEGDRVGVMKNSAGELLFYVNGECQGVASRNLPPIVYAVVDMYGKCAQITITNPSTPDSNPLDDDSVEEAVDSLHENQISECAIIDTLLRPPLAPTASEDGSLTETTCSGLALTHHIANIGIANSFISGHDSNLLEEERDTCDSQASSNLDSARSPLRGNDSALALRNDAVQRRLNDAENCAALESSDRLRFHEKTGLLVRLSCGGRSAERKRPRHEFNHGVVMSNRSLRINELFEIRIDRLVDKWSGSIEVGVTTHNPAHLEFPATMTSMRSGTIMMSGTAILTNGKGTVREYGSFNLDELKEGDRIGMMIKGERDLHYYINGMEQGVASSNVPHPVWAVVDLYGMTVKVTIGDGLPDRCESNAGISRRNSSLNNELQSTVENAQNDYDNYEDNNNHDHNDNRNPLLFHSTCGSYAEVINGGRTAHRPNAADDFNNGVVLSNRPLLPGEIFEVRLDTLVDKWAGSLEIGVTTHCPTEMDFPSTMTNVRSGTWLMTSCNITHNGTTILETYGLNLDRLKVGDRIGVCRKGDGTLHFYINGVDRGVAVSNLPERVYGVVDLYGQASRVTICSLAQRDPTPASDVPVTSGTNSTIYSDLRFHHLHGQNVRVVRGGLLAQRPNADSEFNDAIVMSNRPLHDGEMFEVMIERMVDRWSGSLEAGMTAIAPEQIDFPSTMTDIDYETWMLSGSSVMRNGVTTMNSYACDLDTLEVGTVIGMMRHIDGTLHYYVNREDQGVACGNLKPGLWAVIDLYGQCAQVSILHNPVRSENSLMPISPYQNVSQLSLTNVAQPSSIGTEVLHHWSKCCGANIVLSNNERNATRVRHFNHGLIFSSHPLEIDEMFEIRLEKVNGSLSGSVRVGLTSLPIGDSYPPGNVPSTLATIDTADTWWVQESTVRRSGAMVLRLNYCPSLNRLQPGDTVGVKITPDRTLRVFINGMDMGPAANNISKQRVFAVVELFGRTESVSICSFSRDFPPATDGAVVAPCVVSQDSLEFGPIVARGPTTLPSAVEAKDTSKEVVNEMNEHFNLCTSSGDRIRGPDSALPSSSSIPGAELRFHENRGRNIELSRERNVASRVESYNQGIVLSAKPLPRGFLFQVRAGALQSRWSSSLMIGITAETPDKLVLPNSAFDLKKNTWIICADSVYFNAVKIKGRYGPNLDNLTGGCGGHVIGVLVDHESRLHLYVNGVDQGVAAKEIPSNPYCIIDLYGQCQQVSITGHGVGSNTTSTTAPETRSSMVAEAEPLHHKNNIKNQQNYSTLHHSSHSLHHQLNLQQQQLHTLSSIQQTNYQANSSVSQRSLSREEQTNNDVNAHRRARNTLQTSHITPSSTTVKDKSKESCGNVPESCLIKNCEYQNLCHRFRSSLALPDAYFSRDGDLCFCETCHKIRGDEQFHTKGNPPKRYAQPIGWCRFSLVTSVGQSNDEWHMAYHGIKGGAIRRMLDKGELLFQGELGVNTRLPNRKSKDDVSDGSVLLFSPSIASASRDEFAAPLTFVDPPTGRQMGVKLVLQVAVEPGSYKVVPVDPISDGVRHPKLNSFESESSEWVTKERGATQLLALLVQIEAK